MKRATLCLCSALLMSFVVSCGGAGDTGATGDEPAPAAEPAAAEPEAAPVDDAPRFAGGWKSDEGQFTEYVYEDGTLYVLFGDERNECTLEGGEISYRAAGMTTRMNYRFLDEDTIEYTSSSAPGWKLVQKRQP